MPVKSLNYTKPNSTTQAGAQIKKVDGSVYIKVASTVYNPNDEGENRTINQSTGYFGTKIGS